MTAPPREIAPEPCANCGKARSDHYIVNFADGPQISGMTWICPGSVYEASPAPSAEPPAQTAPHAPGAYCTCCTMGHGVVAGCPNAPAQAATERMGTHWETCATDGGPRHYDCALRLIEQQAREIAELRNANSSFASRAICHGSRADGLLTCPKAPCDLCLHWQHERAERAEERVKELEAQIANKS